MKAHHYPATLPPDRIAAIDRAAAAVRDELLQANVSAANAQALADQYAAVATELRQRLDAAERRVAALTQALATCEETT